MRSFLARCADLVLPMALLLGIGAVLALTRWSVPPGTINELEMRPALMFPSFQKLGLAHFFPHFFDYFNDNFGLRDWGVRERTRIWLWLLRRDPAPDAAFSAKVYPGRDDWLFFAGDRVPQDILHTDPLSKAELDSWAKGIAERRAWLAARGIRYVFVLAPDKRTIYPDRLPAFYAEGRPGETRRQQLDARLAGDPAYLDLTDAVRAGTDGKERLYFRWDTHWNHAGAYLGYRAMMARLGLPALPENLGRPPEPALHDGDLGRMIGLRLADHDEVPAATCPRPAPAADAAAVAGLQGADPLYSEPSTVCAGAPGRLLLFHDSFAEMWKQYLSTQFGFTAYAWSEPSFAELKRVVEAVHPSVVIEERVERFLILPLR